MELLAEIVLQLLLCLADIVLQLLIHVVGYPIAYFAFPWISSGRIVVQPFDGEFFHGFYRPDDFGRIEIESGAATALGFLIFLVFIASFFLMLLVFDHLAALSKVQVPQTQSAQSMMPTLSLSYRNDVIQIQRRLIELGFLPGGFFPEGNWGPISQQALLEFKKQSGLGSSNAWDSTTRSALFSGHATHALSRQR
jgi:hypothetical protein